MIKKFFVFLLSLVVLAYMISLPFQLNFEYFQSGEPLFPDNLRQYIFFGVLILTLVVLYHRFWDLVNDKYSKQKLPIGVVLCLGFDISIMCVDYLPDHLEFLIFISFYILFNVSVHATSAVKVWKKYQH